MRVDFRESMMRFSNSTMLQGGTEADKLISVVYFVTTIVIVRLQCVRRRCVDRGFQIGVRAIN